MRIKEIYKILKEKTNNKVTQNDIAQAIGTSRANVSKLISKNSFINDEKIKLIEEFFSIKLTVQCEFKEIYYFPDELAKIQNNKIVFSDKKIKFYLPKTFLNFTEKSNYIMFNANDKSMYPTIMEGDSIIIDTTCNDIESNKVYAFIYDETIYIRRLLKNITEIIIEADNRAYSKQKIAKEDINKIYLIGRVVNVIKSSISL